MTHVCAGLSIGGDVWTEANTFITLTPRYPSSEVDIDITELGSLAPLSGFQACTIEMMRFSWSTWLKRVIHFG